MCNEILVSPTSPYGRCLIKVLPHCGVMAGDQTNLKLIHSLVEQIIDEVGSLIIVDDFSLVLICFSYSCAAAYNELIIVRSMDDVNKFVSSLLRPISWFYLDFELR